MALTGWSETNYLHAVTPVWPGQLPFIYSIWCWKNAPGVASWAVALGDADSADNERSLILSATDELIARSRSTVVGEARTGSLAPDQEWFHHAGAFVASANREVWFNGGSKVTDITSITPVAPSSTRIGLRKVGTFPWQNTGALASFSAWDAAGMTVQERDALVAELATGTNPLTLNLENSRLVDYAGLEDTNDLGPFAMQGTLTVFGSSPPVDEPPSTNPSPGLRRRGVRVITGADPQFPLPVRKHRQIVADPKYRRHILHQDPDAPIYRWVQVVPGPLPVRKHVSIEGL